MWAQYYLQDGFLDSAEKLFLSLVLLFVLLHTDSCCYFLDFDKEYQEWD
ncbi:hypothetical protein [Legionella quateirensis]|nr:hypothetical protein [Legionella quateirensis]